MKRFIGNHGRNKILALLVAVISAFGTTEMAAEDGNADLPDLYATPVKMDMNPYFPTSSRISYKLTLRNTGTQNLSSVTVLTSINNGVSARKSISLGSSLTPGNERTITVNNIVNLEDGAFVVSVKIVKANNQTIDDPEEIIGTYASFDNGFMPRPVIEEGTGINCPTAPVGIEMRKLLKERYPDWILVSVQGAVGEDPMAAESYQDMSEKYFGGSHSAIANRSIPVTIDLTVNEEEEEIDFSELEKKLTGYPSMANLHLQGKINEDKTAVTVSSIAQFACPVTFPLSLQYILVEDEVADPETGFFYEQANGFAGGAKGEMMGWETLPESVPMAFNDVARCLDGYEGIEGSMPDEIAAHEVYSYERTISLEGIHGDKFRVVGMIVEADSGRIVNANQISMNKVPSACIETNDMQDLTAEGKVMYFTIDGRPVNAGNLTPGIYVKVCGGVAKKIIIK